MLTILLTALALAGEPVLQSSANPDAATPVTAERGPAAQSGRLVFDSRLPAEVMVDGKTVAKLFRDGVLTVEVPAGVRALRVYTNGSPEDLEVVVPVGGELAVLVGRMGLSVDPRATQAVATEVAMSDVSVQVRMAGPIGARLMLGNERYEVGAGSQVELSLPTGDHALSVRNENGTVVWATGTLKVQGPDPVVVQLSEGRLPEVSGRGAFASRR